MPGIGKHDGIGGIEVSVHMTLRHVLEMEDYAICDSAFFDSSYHFVPACVEAVACHHQLTGRIRALGEGLHQRLPSFITPELTEIEKQRGCLRQAEFAASLSRRNDFARSVAAVVNDGFAYAR